MLKILAIFALALLVLPVKTDSQPHKAQQASEDSKPASTAPKVVPQQSSGTAIQKEYQKEGPYDIRVISTPHKDGYDYASLIINLALALVGIGGIGVAICTLDKISRQTNATEASAKSMLRSVLLQEAQFRQWVETSDQWEVLRSNVLPHIREAAITFEFGITNPTNWPLTLVNIGTIVGNGPTVTISPEYELRPDEAYPMALQTTIAGNELERFRANSLDVDLTIFVRFKDVLGKNRSQPFYLSCRGCGIGNLRCTVYPRQPTEYDRQNPN